MTKFKRNIKWMALAVIALTLAPLLVFAQEIVPPTSTDWNALFAAIGGLKGASSLALAAVVVQALMLALRSQLGEKAGKYRMLAMLGLTMVASILSQRDAGITDWSVILSNTAVLAAGQNFIHQLWKQFVEKTE